MKKNLLLAVLLLFTYAITAQTSNVVINVNWPEWSSENKVELQDPSGTIITPIVDNGYDGNGNGPYTSSVDYLNLANADDYIVKVYDFWGDDWNSSGSMEILVDGVSVFQFNGDFDNNVTSGNPVEISKTFMFNVQDPAPLVPGVAVFDTTGNEYIEYIPGNLPIIISAPHGGVKQSGETIGGTFYPDNDGTLSDRSCGTNERDDNTDILIREIQAEIFNLTGCYAHVIISNLHRSKLDPNREINEAACGDSDAEALWNTWHGFIDTASTSVEANWGKGLYIDLHGQSHTIQRIEAGYNITASELDAGAATVNGVTGTSIANLVIGNINSYTQDELVRGPFSLGEYFQDAPGTFYNANNNPGCGVTSGYRTVPSNTDHGGGNSCDDQTPHGNPYFNGDFYNNVRHGSGSAASDGVGGSGTVDGIMTEVNRRVRDLGTYNGNVYDNRPQTLVPFAKDYAAVVLAYIDKHYNDFTLFNYDAAAYETTDPSPTPTITGVSGGTFSSTIGLTIDPNTGVIDTANSSLGNYVVTYEAGTCGYYSTTQNVEITESTLSVTTFEDISFRLYPNPTTGIINFISDKAFSEVKVYSIVGQQVIFKKINSSQSSIDLSQLESGSYILSFIIDGKAVGTKLIVKN